MKYKQELYTITFQDHESTEQLSYNTKSNAPWNSFKGDWEPDLWISHYIKICHISGKHLVFLLLNLKENTKVGVLAFRTLQWHLMYG